MGWKNSVWVYKFQWSACWCMQAVKVRNAGIQEPVATSPSHQETLELLKGKAKTTHLRHTFSHIRTLCYLYYTHCLISPSCSCIRIQTTHTNTHMVITTCRLSYPDLCALDCRAGLWCIVHYKPWFNSKNRKSPHKISVIHFDKLQQNKEILTELCLWVQPLWRSNMPSPLSIAEYILIYKNFSTH